MVLFLKPAACIIFTKKKKKLYLTAELLINFTLAMILQKSHETHTLAMKPKKHCKCKSVYTYSKLELQLVM